MQRVVIDQPYTFIPPRYSRFWHGLVRMVLPRLLRKQYGISRVECEGVEKLQASLRAGHGVVIAPNHCRPCDPMVLDTLSAAVRRPFHIISSWHVFMTNRIQKFLLPRLGGFSIHREGMDRESLKCAVRIAAGGKHPLVIFPEGIITRSNDRLVHLMEGPAFVARNAAKQHPQGKVMIHPVFIRYFFEADLEGSLIPVIEEIESRLSWQTQSRMPVTERIAKLGDALLALKEIEYLQAPQSGTTEERIQRLIDHLLAPLETQWAAARHDGDTMSRVKRLRSAILPDLTGGNLTDDERSARWRQLSELYLVQQLHCYPGGYFENPTPERLIETVERYEEDLTDQARPHHPLRAVITVGDAIEVGTGREQTTESITRELRERLASMLEETRRRII